MAEPTFEQYVASRGASLLRLATVLTGDPHGAQDLVQTALLKASGRWRRVSRLDHPDAYVRKIIVNRYVSDRRRRSSTELVTAAVPERGGVDMVDQLGVRDELRRVLATLAARQRAVLVLRYYADLGDAEIAALLGCGESTVRSQASRALATVRDRLETVRAEEP
ncbi:MAG TPA: SigE family RNA polymerase sigma factor [Mycobacteriales bacterium]